MEVATLLKSTAASVVAIGGIGGGVIALDTRHAPMSVMGEIGVMEIFDLVEIAQRDGKEDWICRAIDQAIIDLCSKNQDHYLCRDSEAAKNLKKKAGCE